MELNQQTSSQGNNYKIEWLEVIKRNSDEKLDERGKLFCMIGPTNSYTLIPWKKLQRPSTSYWQGRVELTIYNGKQP